MDLKVFLKLDGSGFQQGITRARQTVNAFGSDMKSRIAGAFTVGALTYGAKQILNYADTIEETASRIGVSTDSLQEWTFAAKQAGVSAEKLQNFIERLSAAAADSKLADAWARIGINPAQTPEALFKSVQAKTQGQSPTEIISMLRPLMDFRAIGPMVNVLASDLSSTSEAARKLGAVIDQATIQHLAKLNDQLSIVSQILMANFAPALLFAGKAAVAIFQVGKGASGWWGAKTANLQFEDVFWSGTFEGFLNLWGKLKQGKEMGLDKMADSERDNAMRELDTILAKLAAFTPFVPQVIESAGVESASKAGSKRLAQSSDSLIGIGNFLGSGRGNIDGIAKETNRILREHTILLRRIADKSSGLDINVP